MSGAQLHYQVTTESPVVGFEREGFGRHVTLHGRRAFRLSPSCNTCAFLFERIQSSLLSPTQVSDALLSGANLLDEKLLGSAAALLPADDYAVVAPTIQPRLTFPCDPNDYFSHESIDLFGINTMTGVPDSPRIPYWLAGSLTLPPGTGAWPALDGPKPRPTNPKLFFHFVVPLEPPNWLSKERIAHYQQLLAQGGRPAALGVSVLEVRSPAVTPSDKGGDPNYAFAEHWCLATYLLDGHHKVQAAASGGHAVQLLTFISRGASISSEADIDAVVGVLTT